MAGIPVKIQNVHKHFDDLTVINGIELEIKSGEFIAIVGRSGCGKSTLLRLLSGLESISSGKIQIDQTNVKGLHADLRIMFQDARLLPWKTVIENVEIGLKKADRLEASRALQSVGLAKKEQQWPSNLSGGQRQRVSLARALVGKPKLLLLDEPLGALDALTRIEMQELIESLWIQQRFTSILVTHDVSEAVALADRVILIEDGKIALEITIDLPRPREKNSQFAYYEKQILDQLMKKVD